MYKSFVTVVFISCLFVGFAGEIVIRNGEKVAFLGDSIAAGGKQPSRYMDLVTMSLAHYGIKIQRIDAGIPGFRSDLLLHYLNVKVLKYKPNAVVIGCGINDIGRWNGGKQIPPEQYRQNMRVIVQKCQTAGARCYLLTITPVTEQKVTKYTPDILRYNSIIRELAAECKCPVIDAHQAWWDEYDRIRKKYPDARARGYLMTYDSVHLNPNGHRALAKAILKVFGMTDKQIAESEKDWQKVNWKQQIETEYEMTLEDFDRYSEEGYKKKLSISRSIGNHVKAVKK